MVEQLNVLHKAQESLHESLQREPTLDELIRATHFGPDKISELRRYSRTILSLYEDLRYHVALALRALEDRAADVIRIRFELEGRRRMTLEEIGKKYGLTRESIRQIEVKAIDQLRRRDLSNPLRDYVP
jgi:RNA polymerase primary sigma factor